MAKKNKKNSPASENGDLPTNEEKKKEEPKKPYKRTYKRRAKPQYKPPSQLSFPQFLKLYPNDDTCLEVVFDMRYPPDENGLRLCTKCQKRTIHIRLIARKCYRCRNCRHHVYPLAGTVMEGSNTMLVVWFYAMYQFSICKNGISAKELQRALGVTYKTAWSIGIKIREALSAVDKDGMLFSGTVELDEALIGGKVRGGKRGWGAENKTCLFGIKERGGRVKVIAVNNRERETLFPLIKLHVEEGSKINTDEFKVYHTLNNEGYTHDTVVHSDYQWSKGETHTNSIEGYWSNLKKSILGTHTYVSPKHMQKYLCEFDFRHNNRNDLIFNQILKKVYGTPYNISVINTSANFSPKHK